MNRRTHTCGELTSGNLGEEVCLNGWVNAVRFHGQIVFVDLRDRYGKTQIVYNQDSFNGDFELVKKLSKIFANGLKILTESLNLSNSFTKFGLNNPRLASDSSTSIPITLD